MAKDPITASDTVRALNGQPSVEQADYNQSVAEALNGTLPGQHKANQSILEALNGGQPMEPVFEDVPRIGSGTMTASESERKWLSDLAIEAADSALGNALMHKHPGMTAGALSAQARTIIGECYAEGAKRSDSEIERLDYAAEKAKRIAQEMITESADKPATQVQESKAPVKKLERIQESQQPVKESGPSPLVVSYESSDGKELSRRRLTIAEAGALAAQPNGKLVIEQAQRFYDVTKGNAAP
ncbi:hypothetical protein [Glutamicibacter nicotianae]|uniref:hypothetical protein n=1 Tax=Glutamicibacter nicotianae TaxID=37929 RepID=UPI000EF930A5|nr:hypothetical protein [Glutamicibacter nicotianae]